VASSKAAFGWVTAIAYLCLFLLSLIDILKGATLPSLIAERSLSIPKAD